MALRHTSIGLQISLFEDSSPVANLSLPVHTRHRTTTTSQVSKLPQTSPQVTSSNSSATPNTMTPPPAQQHNNNLFTRVAQIFSHKPSLWVRSLDSSAAKERAVPAYNNAIASIRR